MKAALVTFAPSHSTFGQNAKLSIDSLGWISGCWEQNDTAKKTLWVGAVDEAVGRVDDRNVEDGEKRKDVCV